MEQSPGPQAHIVVSVVYNPEDVNKISSSTPQIRGANAATSHSSLTAGTPIFRFSDPDDTQSIQSAYVNGIPKDWKMDPIGVVYRGSDPHIGSGHDNLVAVQPSGSTTMENKTSVHIKAGDLIGFVKPKPNPSSSALTAPEMVVLNAKHSEEQLCNLRKLIVKHGSSLDFVHLANSTLDDYLIHAILEKLNISRIVLMSWIAGIKFGLLKPTLPSLNTNSPSSYNGAGFDETVITAFSAELSRFTESPLGALSETFYENNGSIRKAASTHGVTGSDEYLQDCARYLSHFLDLFPEDERNFKGNLVGHITALLYPTSAGSQKDRATLNDVLGYPVSNSTEGFNGVVKLVGSPAAEESISLEIQKSTARESFGIALSDAAPGAPVVVVLSK